MAFGWVTAHARMVLLVKAASPTYRAAELGDGYHHQPDGMESKNLTTRSFWFDIVSIDGMVGQYSPTLPRRTRARLSLVMHYRKGANHDAIMRAIAEDHSVLAQALNASAEWEQVTSGIENLAADDEMLLPAELVEVDGGVRVHFGLTVEYRVT